MASADMDGQAATGISPFGGPVNSAAEIGFLIAFSCETCYPFLGYAFITCIGVFSPVEEESRHACRCRFAGRGILRGRLAADGVGGGECRRAQEGREEGSRAAAGGDARHQGLVEISREEA